MTGESIAVVLEARTDAAARTRQAVDRVAAGLAGDIGFRARLAASELVANSVAHAAGGADDRVELAVLRTGTSLRVEVRDAGAPFDGAARAVSERATSGRGLRLVEALVDRWGVQHERGNLVWFEIDEASGDDGDPRSRSGTAGGAGRRRDEAAHVIEQDAAAALVLARAAERIREGWCRAAEARDAAGSSVDPRAAEATAWSLHGSLVAAMDATPAAQAAARDALAELLEQRSLAGWNDAPARTQEEVVEVLERARMLLSGPRVSA